MDYIYVYIYITYTFVGMVSIWFIYTTHIHVYISGDDWVMVDLLDLRYSDGEIAPLEIGATSQEDQNRLPVFSLS